MAHRVLSNLRRRVFAGLAILSLVLCVAFIALWVRSYWRSDSVDYKGALPNVDVVDYRGFTSNRGELGFYTMRFVQGRGSFVNGWHLHTNVASPSNSIASFAASITGAHSLWLAGFGYTQVTEYLDEYVMQQRLIVGIPLWFAVLIFAILPAIRLRAILPTRRRNRVGFCPACGYDTRANPATCSECGFEVRKQA